MPDGILLLDKPKDFSSHGAVNKVKGMLGISKAGHTGTLDPFATGVLPVCFNKATKLIPFLKEETKEYISDMILGVSTDTMDYTGKITSQNDINGVNEDDLNAVLSGFRGKIKQIPPMYSALKINGKRLYKLARDGIEIERKPRDVYIKDLKLLEFDPPVAKLYVNCSKGTYVRALASDIGDKLGCGAHLSSLRRQSSGVFHIDNSFTFEDIEAGNYKLLSASEILSAYECINVNEELANKIKNGIHITKELFGKVLLPNFSKMDILTTLFEGKILSLTEAQIDSTQFESAQDKDIIFQHLRVFN